MVNTNSVGSNSYRIKVRACHSSVKTNSACLTQGYSAWTDAFTVTVAACAGTYTIT